MRTTSHSSNQLQTVFGGEFVQEHHLDDIHRFLPHPDVDQLIRTLTASMLGKLMKSLRSALSLQVSAC
jgi:hypothetical protein